MKHEPRLRINMFGFFSARRGLGIAARSYLKALVAGGADVHAVDEPVEGGAEATDSIDPDLILHRANEPVPHDVDLFVMNPYAYRRFVTSRPRAVGRRRERPRLVLPFWELGELPPSWIPILSSVDGVLAPTEFVRHTILRSVDRVPVRYGPLPLQWPGEQAGEWPSRRCLVRNAPVRQDRTTGRPVTFLTSFDYASEVVRKNPLGVLEAFRRAFPGRDDVRLVLKSIDSVPRAETTGYRAEVRRHIDGDPRVRVIDRSMPHERVQRLIRDSDVYVSLHRAEGLGLGMLEAMALGKPVIATGWSGNLEYMTEEDACLVDHRLVPVRGVTHPAYVPDNLAPGARWAEPDLDHAASWMRRLADDPTLRTRIGRRAVRAARARMDATPFRRELRALVERITAVPTGSLRETSRSRPRRERAPSGSGGRRTG